MKEGIETTHFEHNCAILRMNRAAKPLLTKQVEVLCVSPQPLPWGFSPRVMSVKFLYFTVTYKV